MNGSIRNNVFYLDKLHLVEKGNFIPAKSIFTSAKNRYGFQNNQQLNKIYKSVTDFLISDCISVSF